MAAISGEPTFDDVYIYDLSHSAGLLIREKIPDSSSVPPGFKSKASADRTGWTVWAGSIMLSRWIVENRDIFRGAHVLELGSGCGLAGLAVALHTESASVTLSDYEEGTLNNMIHNVKMNLQARGLGVQGSSPEGTLSAPFVAPFLQELGTVPQQQSEHGTAASCRLFSLRMDWDTDKTWPRLPSDSAAEEGHGGLESVAAGEEKEREGTGSSSSSRRRRGDSASSDDSGAPFDERPFFPYDIIIASDCTYKKAYARKLGNVVRALLAPPGPSETTSAMGAQAAPLAAAASTATAAAEAAASPLLPPSAPLASVPGRGLFLYSTPTAREGLPVLESLLKAWRFSIKEMTAPWKECPLRGCSAEEGAGKEGGEEEGRREDSGAGAAAGTVPSISSSISSSVPSHLPLPPAGVSAGGGSSHFCPIPLPSAAVTCHGKLCKRRDRSSADASSSAAAAGGTGTRDAAKSDSASEAIPAVAAGNASQTPNPLLSYCCVAPEEAKPLFPELYAGLYDIILLECWKQGEGEKAGW